jgi:hypothetical protein
MVWSVTNVLPASSRRSSAARSLRPNAVERANLLLPLARVEATTTCPHTLLLMGWTYDHKGTARTGKFVKKEVEMLSGDAYSGTFEVTYYDLDGNITFDHSGTVTGVRIENQ